MSKRRPRWQPPIPSREMTRCAWTKCPKLTYKEAPLCWSHLEVAAKLWEANRDKPQDRMPINPPVTVNYSATVDSEPEPTTEPAGTVYFVRSGGYIKIGWTSDLAKRMRAYPPDTTLLAVMPGTRKDERATHRRFAHLLTHGREWFPLAPQILEHIDQVVAEHGAPPVVDFAAKRATRIVGPRLHNYVGGQRGKLPTRTVRG